jgi:hypothetical protein
MIDSDLIYFLLGAALGAFVSWRIATHFHTSMIGDILARAGVTPEKLQSMMTDMEQELGMESEPSDELPVVAIKIEKSGDMLYAFRKDTDQFLGQGTTGQALIERMSVTMRDVKLVVAKEDGGEFLGSQNFTYDTASKVFSQE